jgi:hypothetical protein
MYYSRYCLQACSEEEFGGSVDELPGIQGHNQSVDLLPWGNYKLGSTGTPARLITKVGKAHDVILADVTILYSLISESRKCAFCPQTDCQE